GNKCVANSQNTNDDLDGFNLINDYHRTDDNNNFYHKSFLQP
ncbi:3533_t:CDS:1, partial [Funneliformis geosporum]